MIEPIFVFLHCKYTCKRLTNAHFVLRTFNSLFSVRAPLSVVAFNILPFLLELSYSFCLNVLLSITIHGLLLKLTVKGEKA